MFIEAVDPVDRSTIFDAYFAMTQAALIEVIGSPEHEAAIAVGTLKSRFVDAPKQEQDFLLNIDPVARACELSGIDWDDLDRDQIAHFNAARAPVLDGPLLRAFNPPAAPARSRA